MIFLEKSCKTLIFLLFDLGALGRSFFEFPNSFQKRQKNHKNIKEKREFLRQTSFRPNRFFYMVVIQKLITVNTVETVYNDTGCNDILGVMTLD
ncbi:Uncharacterized protein FWK35_00028615 [Aphis craccivora]|uniref:Secreted protein n=1 Tax=Aphis craccivora TaxID=307492 RepID=A0A6G0VZJ8_APHCR|nr:Uncharacterized protein FWK35_00028615 [Aphis craccivora]